MTTLAVVALTGWAMGRHPVEMAALVAVHVVPLPTIAAILVLVLRSGALTPPARSRSALALVRLSADLAAGATPRQALVELASDDPALFELARLGRAGRPLTELATALEPAFGSYGRIAGAALRMAATSGGPLAPVVDRVAAEVLALDDLRRERRAAAAPAVLQAAILAGAPACLLVWMMVSGRLWRLLAGGGAQALLAIVGGVLVATGIGAVLWITGRRSAGWRG
jgi:hypothetical protein